MDDADFSVCTEEADEQLCWRLMARAAVGRLAFVDPTGPTVLPVNCAALDRTVVFRTDAGTAIAAVAPGTMVAFEVDDTDRATKEGWSVLVRGRLWPVFDREGVERLDQLPLRPWVEGAKDLWMRVVPTAITGRVTSRHRVAPLLAGRPYMPPG